MSKCWAGVAVTLLAAGAIHPSPAAAQTTGSLPVTARVMSQEAGRSYVAALALMGAPLSKGGGTPLPLPQLATVTWAGHPDRRSRGDSTPRVIVIQYLKN